MEQGVQILSDGAFAAIVAAILAPICGVIREYIRAKSQEKQEQEKTLREWLNEREETERSRTRAAADVRVAQIQHDVNPPLVVVKQSRCRDVL